MATAFAFPASPTLGQIASLPDGNQAQWNGYAWVEVGQAGVTYPITVALGGTGAADAPNARINLGLNAATGEFIVQKDGTVALPGIAFASEPGLGWYRIGASDRGYAVQGSLVEELYTGAANTTQMSLLPRANGTAHVILRNQAKTATDYNFLRVVQNADGTGTIQTGAGGSATRGNLTLDAPTVLMPGGTATITGVSNPALVLNKNANGNAGVIGQTQGNARWALNLGNADVESGNQAGSNFTIGRYSDAGAWLGDAFTIRRSDGFAAFNTFQVRVTNPSAGDASLTLVPSNGGSVIQLNKNTTSFNSIYGLINSVVRWQFSLGNASQNVEFSRFNSSGGFVGASLTIDINTGNVTAQGLTTTQETSELRDTLTSLSTELRARLAALEAA